MYCSPKRSFYLYLYKLALGDRAMFPLMSLTLKKIPPWYRTHHATPVHQQLLSVKVMLIQGIFFWQLTDFNQAQID